jgi:integrase
MGWDVERMKVSDIGEAEIRHFQNYILYNLKLSDVSHDKAIRLMGSFINTIKKMGFEGRNVFEGIPRKSKGREVEILTNEEIQGVLQKMDDPNPKNHIHTNGKSMKKDWNKFAVLTGALTGRRNEEIAMLKWNNLVFDEDQNPQYIKSIDLKVSRKKGIEKTNPKPIFIPVIPQLKQLLTEMGMEKYKGSDKHLLAPEENISRDTLKLHLSRMFTFYYDKLGTGRQMQYKHLRKFYISHLASYIGIENAQLITGHSGIAIMNSAYVDKKVLAINETTKNMNILGNQNNNRIEELKSIRKESDGKSIEI